MDQVRTQMNDAVLPYRSHPPLGSIRLIPGTPFYEGQRNMLAFLARQDIGSLLYNFRKEAGLPTGDAEPMTGWDAEECKLKGHTTGHYLSAVSLAYAATGDEKYRDIANELVDGFAECQEALAASGRVNKGFLSAYDEEQFDLLEKLTKYPEIWAPYYTLDKIMSGLLDAYELAGVSRAESVLVPLGDWIYNRLSRVPAELRTRMWDTYIAGEYGAMIGTLVRLYRISGKKEHIEAAKMFENAKLFDQMRDGRDELDSMHANQHIPQISGALELYAAIGEADYLEIARNFEKTVTMHHCYSIGGTGDEERFRAADCECEYLTEKTAESCASVNMLRVTSRLYEFENSLRTELMDYYERTLFNHILMSFSHHDDGGTTYFMPLAPGSSKHYETEENSCCHGTGMESRFRYMRDIYSYEGEGDDAVIRVELPVSSELDDEEKLKIVFSEDGKFSVTACKDMLRNLEIRIPKWARENFPGLSNGYLRCGKLKSGESISIELPMNMRVVNEASDPDFYNLSCGPYLLAAVSDSKDFLDPELDKEISLKPLYKIDEEHYHVYFKHR